MNTADFIDGLRKQDPAAAKHLNECFVPSIWRFVFFRVDRDSHLAEDIVAETVLALVTAAASQTAIENPAAWLRTVALRRIQDHFRAAARVQHLIEQVQRQIDPVDDQDPAAKHDEKLKRQSVREAMDELPDAYRMALEWKYVDHLSVKVIAQRLDATEKSAESILFRARRALRSQLQEDNPEPPGRNEAVQSSRGESASRQIPGGQASANSNESSPDSKPSTGNSDESSMQEHPSMFNAPRFVRET